MGTPRDATSQGRLLLPLLLLLLAPATAKVLSYQQAVQRAVDSFNEDLAEGANLFRLLSLDSQPPRDKDPYSPKPVTFTVKETVCTKPLKGPLEQCDFKEDGVVKRCTGTVTLDEAINVLVLSCHGGQRVRRMVGLRKFFKKVGKKIKKAGKKIVKALGKIGPIRYQYRF